MDAYRELFERSADAILIIEGDRFIDCNQATVEMLRYRDKAELLSTHPSELSPPTQPDGRASYEKANEMMAIAFARGSHRFEWNHRRADGEVFPVEVLLTAVQERGRSVLHVVWRDITERKRLEAHLRHAQKMEAIGKLAGGIAHDFNNLLVAIVGNTELALALLGEGDQASEPLAEVLYASERAAELVRQLLAFGRKQELVPRRLDLNAHLRSVRSLLQRVIGEDVRLVDDLGEGPLVVAADPVQLEQVLLNVASNARDAMPDGGRLTLATRLVEGAGPAERGGALGPGRYAELRLSDTGTGMTKEIAARAFDPFVTTKPVGAGTGLGLATVKSIVGELGGTARLESELGRGTTVVVALPLADGAPDHVAQPERVAVPGPQGHERLLFVEDDEAVRATVAQMLRRAGYEVVEASDGHDGMRRYREQPEAFALVISDVIMPELSGVEFIEALREAGHAPPVLFLSGYTARAYTRFAELDPSTPLLTKPFTSRDLLEAVRRAIDAG